jgi:hypothetical protein
MPEIPVPMRPSPAKASALRSPSWEPGARTFTCSPPDSQELRRQWVHSSEWPTAREPDRGRGTGDKRERSVQSPRKPFAIPRATEHLWCTCRRPTEEWRSYLGDSPQGSTWTLQRGAGHCSRAHVKKSMPSGSLIVRCSLERTIHGRSGSCSVMVKPYSRIGTEHMFASSSTDRAGHKAAPADLPGLEAVQAATTTTLRTTCQPVAPSAIGPRP